MSRTAQDVHWRAGYADCSLGQLHYLASQPTGGGEPIILLNPRSRTCRPLLPLLAPRHPLFVIDIPGFGMSSAPKSAVTMPEIGSTIAAFMDAVGLPAAHVFGIHTGGKVAAALAADHPAKGLSLIVCGKTHSLVADQAARNAAMRGQLDSNYPDAQLLKLEGKFLDDIESAPAGARLYEANFAFDFAGALAQAAARTLVIEITSPDEDRQHGRHGASLAAKAKRGLAVTLPQIEATGIDFYVGAARMAETIAAFVENRLKPGDAA